MPLLFNLLCQCHYNFALVWSMPLCTPEAVCGPPAGVLDGSYIRMDKIALAQSLSLVSLTCGTHTSGSSSTSHWEREKDWEGGSLSASELWPTSLSPTGRPATGELQSSATDSCYGRPTASSAGRGLHLPWATPAVGELRRSRAPTATGDPSRGWAPLAVSSANRGRPHRGRARAPPAADSASRGRASPAAGSPSRVGHAWDPPPPANGSRRRGGVGVSSR
jgi:hypothetical protein